MKRVYFSLLFVTFSLTALPCDVCNRRAGGFLQWFGHGAGPQSQWDYLIVSVAMAIVVYSGWRMVAAIIKPGERSPTHIKQVIINEQP